LLCGSSSVGGVALVHRLTERAQAILFVAVLAGAIAGLYGAIQASQPSPVGRSEVHSIRLNVNAGEWSIRYTSEVTANNTVFAILIEASNRLGFRVEFQRYEIPSGVLVLAINGSENGSEGRYWQYWVNDVYGRVAADLHELHDEDNVEWRFSIPQEGG
jgi:hypothetical protein